MKKLFKKTAAAPVTLTLCAAFSVSASTGTPKEDPTMRSLQNEGIEYLSENHPDIRFGSKYFAEFAAGVLISNEYEDLKAYENYEDIRFYLSCYMSELEEYQVRNGSGFDKFIPSGEFCSKTISQIQKETRDNMTKMERRRYRKELKKKIIGTAVFHGAEAAIGLLV